MNNPWDYEPGLDYSVYKSPFISVWSHTEVTVLQYLTLKGCKCTPLYIGHEVRVQSDHDYLPGGYVVYTLMEKLPGINLVDWPDFPLEKRNRVRIAFGKAIRYAPLLSQTGLVTNFLVENFTPMVLYTMIPKDIT